jgi:hypothetical protein
VFKGWIEENGTAPVKPGTGLTVAVKTLNHDGLQGHKEWVVRALLLQAMFMLTIFAIYFIAVHLAIIQPHILLCVDLCRQKLIFLAIFTTPIWLD